jgi:hypothetical protein
MAKDKGGQKKGKRLDVPAAARSVIESVGETIASIVGDRDDDHHAAGHAAAKAHGRPATVDGSLPATRAELLELHAAARRKRSVAALGSPDYRAAADEIGRIEIRIAAVERAMTPPKG